MKRNTILGVVSAIIFCAVVAVAFYYVAYKHKSGHGKPPVGQVSRSKGPQHRLAITGDPDRNMEKAMAAEGRMRLG